MKNILAQPSDLQYLVLIHLITSRIINGQLLLIFPDAHGSFGFPSFIFNKLEKLLLDHFHNIAFMCHIEKENFFRPFANAKLARFLIKGSCQFPRDILRENRPFPPIVKVLALENDQT